MPWSPMARSRKRAERAGADARLDDAGAGEDVGEGQDLPRVLGVDHGGAAGHGQDVVGEQGAQREVGDVSRGADNAALGSADQLVVREGTLVGVEVLPGFERERVVASLGVGELDLVPDLEGPATAGGTGRFGHVNSLPGASRRGLRRSEACAGSRGSWPMAATKARSTSAADEDAVDLAGLLDHQVLGGGGGAQRVQEVLAGQFGGDAHAVGEVLGEAADGDPGAAVLGDADDGGSRGRGRAGRRRRRRRPGRGRRPRWRGAAPRRAGCRARRGRRAG